MRNIFIGLEGRGGTTSSVGNVENTYIAVACENIDVTWCRERKEIKADRTRQYQVGLSTAGCDEEVATAMEIVCVIVVCVNRTVSGVIEVNWIRTAGAGALSKFRSGSKELSGMCTETGHQHKQRKVVTAGSTGVLHTHA